MKRKGNLFPHIFISLFFGRDRLKFFSSLIFNLIRPTPTCCKDYKIIFILNHNNNYCAVLEELYHILIEFSEWKYCEAHQYSKWTFNVTSIVDWTLQWLITSLTSYYLNFIFIDPNYTVLWNRKSTLVKKKKKNRAIAIISKAYI